MPKLIIAANDKDTINRYRFGLKDERIIEILLRYITRTRTIDVYPPAYVGYLGFKAWSTIEELVSEFILTQEIFRNTSGRRARHEIVSFWRDEIYDDNGVNRIVEIAYTFAQWYYLQGFQVAFAIHLDTGHPHIHFVINTVNFITGKKYHCNRFALEQQKRYLQNMIENLTGRSKFHVQVNNYVESEEEIDPTVFSYQRRLNAVSFAYEGERKIVY